MPEGSESSGPAKDAVGGRGGELRKQLEAGDVLRADEAEMASVKGADAGCAESLSDGDEAAVDAAEVLIGVLNGERGDSSPVGCRERPLRAAGRLAIRSRRSRARS
jgi:hypothetical protein